MKKIVTMILAFAILAGVFMLSACGELDNVKSIQFNEYPAVTYALKESISDFSIDVEFTDSTPKTTLKYLENKSSISISGFNTNTVGSRTATVKYGKFEIKFDYVVYDPDVEFAGGTGTAVEPYLVASPTHFQNMLARKSEIASTTSGTSTVNAHETTTVRIAGVDVNPVKISVNKKSYYKLIGNIDCSEVVLTNPTPYASDIKTVQYLNGVYNAVIDGNGYTVTINKVNKADGGDVSKANELFGVVGDFTLKNITFNFAAAAGEGACTGLTSAAVQGAIVTFENVTTTGYIDLKDSASSSVGVYMMQASRNSPANKITFTNCTNKTNIYNAYNIHYTSGFINQQGDNPLEATFNNCKNEGRIEGGKEVSAGLLSGSGFKGTYFKFYNCSNTGVILKTSLKGQFAAGDIWAINSNTKPANIQANLHHNDGMTGTSYVDEDLVEFPLTASVKKKIAKNYATGEDADTSEKQLDEFTFTVPAGVVGQIDYYWFAYAGTYPSSFGRGSAVAFYEVFKPGTLDSSDFVASQNASYTNYKKATDENGNVTFTIKVRDIKLQNNDNNTVSIPSGNINVLLSSDYSSFIMVHEDVLDQSKISEADIKYFYANILSNVIIYAFDANGKVLTLSGRV